MKLDSQIIAIGNCYLYKLPNEKMIGFIVHTITDTSNDKDFNVIVVTSDDINLKSTEDFKKKGIVYTSDVFDGKSGKLEDGLFMLNIASTDKNILEKLVYVGKMPVNTKKAQPGSFISGAMLESDLNSILSTLDTNFLKLKKAPLSLYL